MRRYIEVSSLIAVIVVSAGWAGWKLHHHRALRPVAGLIHRSSADRFGHTRGVVQVDLMRQIMAEHARLAPPAVGAGPESGHHVPSQGHPLLGQPAPAFVLADKWGKTWNLGEAAREGPIVVVFYLGSTCMACVTHLTELDLAISRFRARGVRVLAVSADTPEFSSERMVKYGDFQIPFLSDPDRSAALAYGVWKARPGGKKDDGEAQHGTFIVDREGLLRWAYVGDRPFTDINALLNALDGLMAPSSR